MVMKLFIGVVVCSVVMPAQGCFVGSVGIAERTTQALILGGATPLVSHLARAQRSREHAAEGLSEKIQCSLGNIKTWAKEIIYANKRFMACKSLTFEGRHPVRLAVEDDYNLNLGGYEESDLNLNDYDDNRAIVAYSVRTILAELSNAHGDNNEAIDKEYARLLATIQITPQQLKEEMRLAMVISHHYQSMRMQQKTQQLLKQLLKEVDRSESKLSTIQKTQTSSQDELFKILREHTKQSSDASMRRLNYWEMEKE